MHELTGSFRHYAWGSIDVIPTLLGIPATGEPFAEYWLGAHESDGTRSDGVPLAELLASAPEILGEATLRRFHGRLPFLMKVVSASGPMSLQAHPGPAEAALGFRREQDAEVPGDDPQRIYRDPRPKDELIIATDHFHALSGFRDPVESYRLFKELPMRSSLDHLIGPLANRGGSAALAEVFLTTLTYDDPRHELMPELVAAAFERSEAPGDVGEFARTAVELDQFFPGEPAILAALLMNGVHLEAGDGLYIPATSMHSLLHGTAVEVSSCSDNVIRGGLTRKFINVDELVATVNFTPVAPSLVFGAPVDDGVWHYQVPAHDFSAWRLRPAHSIVDVPGAGMPRIVLVLSGAVTAYGPDDATELAAGRSVLVGADETVRLSGDGEVYVATPGER